MTSRRACCGKGASANAATGLVLAVPLLRRGPALLVVVRLHVLVVLLQWCCCCI